MKSRKVILVDLLVLGDSGRIKSRKRTHEANTGEFNHARYWRFSTPISAIGENRHRCSGAHLVIFA